MNCRLAAILVLALAFAPRAFAQELTPAPLAAGSTITLGSPCPGGAAFSLRQIGSTYSPDPRWDVQSSFAGDGPVYMLVCDGDSNVYIVRGDFGRAYIHVGNAEEDGSGMIQFEGTGAWDVLAVTRPDSPLMMFTGGLADDRYMGYPVHPRNDWTSCMRHGTGSESAACNLRGVDPTVLPRPTGYRHFVFVERLAEEGVCTGQLELGYASTSWGAQGGWDRATDTRWRTDLPFAYEGMTFTGICMGTPSEEYADYLRERRSAMGTVRPVHTMDSRMKDDNTMQAYIYAPGLLSHLVFETDLRTGASRILAALQPQLLPEDSTVDTEWTEEEPGARLRRYGVMVGDVNVGRGCFLSRYEGARLVPGRDAVVLFWEDSYSVVVDFTNPAALTARVSHFVECPGGDTLEGREPGNDPEERFDFAFDYPEYDYRNPTAVRPVLGFHYTTGGQRVTFTF